VLVDAGAPRDWELLVRALASMGRGLDNLDAVLITHSHSDHTGFGRTSPHYRRRAGVDPSG
jgi:glyoxylase-like metal-dependent hydrolase (beta-lactamase superfamily II)